MKKRTLLIVIAIAVCALAGGVIYEYAGPRGGTAYGIVMGSDSSVRAYRVSDGKCASALSAAEELEGLISRKLPSSVISVLNSEGKAELPKEVLEILNRSLDVCRNSGGALDVTMGAVSDLWDFDSGSPRLPGDELPEALAAVGYEKLSVDGDTVTLGKGQVLDLGAVGKGAACETAISCLRGAGSSGAVVQIGGSVGFFGKNRNSDDRAWHIGIRDPQKGANDICAVFDLDEGYVSTSGNYEKRFVEDGVAYWHILDRSTGYPARSGLRSVSVYCGDGLLSDALSTACFVLGCEDSLPLLDAYGAEAMFITDGGVCLVTPGLADRVRLSGDAYTIEYLN
ncbi:MAG: FAD:protein FMN transferase [Clostridia bacterium]|nr:FAD:protein FMN transferase [Clostridia bacterium]